MKVNAFVLEDSHPVRGWESRRKVSGVLSGVRFFKKGRTFVALDLSPEQVDRVRNNRFVRLEIMTSPRLIPVPKPTPPEAPATPTPAKKIDPLMQAYGTTGKRRGRKPKEPT